MQEFFIAIMLIFLPDGETKMGTATASTHKECVELVTVSAVMAATAHPDAHIRTSCVSTEAIGQNGV